MSAGPATVGAAARLRPRRALAQVIVSRGLLAVLVAVAGGSFIAARSDASPTSGRADRDPVAGVRAVGSTPDDGATVAAILEGLEEAATRAAGRLTTVDVVVAQNSSASVTLTFEGSGGSATAADRIVAALTRLGFEAPSPRAIVPTPAGSRLDITTARRLSVERLPTRTVELRPLANVIADTVVRSGARLVRLEVADDVSGLVRLGVRGSVEDVIRAVALVELEHTAPVRFVSLGIRTVGEGEREAALAFRVRPAAPSTPPVGP